MGYKKKTPDTVPTNTDSTNKLEQPSEAKVPRYVVVRDGYRVSEREYLVKTDPDALEEVKHWEKVSKNHSTGESVKIVTYDNKLHRIW
jgi:hypothetical protein